MISEFSKVCEYCGNSVSKLGGIPKYQHFVTFDHSGTEFVLEKTKTYQIGAGY